MRIVIALGGNALLRRGEPLTAENQRQNVRIACEQIAKIYPNNELVIVKLGLLCLNLICIFLNFFFNSSDTLENFLECCFSLSIISLHLL